MVIILPDGVEQAAKFLKGFVKGKVPPVAAVFITRYLVLERDVYFVELFVALDDVDVF